MKKIIIILNAVALIVIGALTTSCDKIDKDSNLRINPDGSVTYTTTLHMGAGTKTEINGENGTHSFTEGDKIALIYMKEEGGTLVKVESDALAAGSITNGGKSATFSVTLTDAPMQGKGLFVTYIYPASIATSDGYIDYTNLNSQNGTLTSLASDLDACRKYVEWNGTGDLPSVSLENKIAIGKFTIKNSSNEDITSSITEMTVSDGTNTYTISPSSLSTIWVAMQPVDDKSITVTATDGSYWYNKTTESAQTLGASSIYPINVTMTKFASLSASDVGDIVGSDGRAYDVADIGNLPTGVTALAMVAYKNGSNGLAISLTDIDTYKLNYAQATGEYGIPAWSASYPIVGGSWRIPTEQDWQSMMWGYYVESPEATDISAFQALLGAYGLAVKEYYWTGSEVNTDNARAVYYDGPYAGIYDVAKTFNSHVRACLAF